MTLKEGSLVTFLLLSGLSRVQSTGILQEKQQMPDVDEDKSTGVLKGSGLDSNDRPFVQDKVNGLMLRKLFKSEGKND